LIGVGGDTVACCDKRGRVTVNGTPLTEPYLYPGNAPSTVRFSVKVPAGRIFVMGDHRARSADSRFHLDEPFRGTVPESDVVGRAMVIAWPFGHGRTLREPDTFASVPDAKTADVKTADAKNASEAAMESSPSLPEHDRDGLAVLPTPVELPLVMGVVGLPGNRVRRSYGVRSGRGGCGGRRTIRTRWFRGGA
jgi:signal peptidase I